MSATVSVTREIAASPDEVWALVSDLPRMGEWSPENQGGSWVGGATGPAAGARFKGRNRNGRRSWSTTCRVTDCDPGHLFAFEVTSGPVPVSRWEYRIDATDGGCRVTESVVDRRPRWFVTVAAVATGVRDRVEHNTATMTETLDRLAATAEAD